MIILAIGDVVGAAGLDMLTRHLNPMRSLYGADLVICNGENVSDGRGITPADFKSLLAAGADVVTTGNHVFAKRSVHDALDSGAPILRPANYPAGCPGRGALTLECGGARVLVMNISGTAFMEPLDNPFACVDALLAAHPDAQVRLLDFHAEATSEKGAMAWHLDGRVSAVFGTHTHVPTADERVLPQGTGFISDLGMTGPLNSVLGVRPEGSVRRFKTKLPTRFETADGPCVLQGALFEADASTGRCVRVQRVSI